VLKDTDGIRAPRITYRLSEHSRRMLDHAVERGGEILRAAGAYDLWHEAPIPESGLAFDGYRADGHRPGRIGRRRVGRRRDVKNLFILDGSIFVTAAGVKPTGTIQALPLYMADSIKQRLATVFDRGERDARSRVDGSSRPLSSPVGTSAPALQWHERYASGRCSTVSDSRGPSRVRNGW
jgi:hypothetical protein